MDLNPAAAEMIGTSRDRIVGTICHRCICPNERGRCPITDLHQDLDNAESTLLTADGGRVDVIKSVVRFNLNGRECLLETFIDNTERKIAADELHAAYAKVTVAEEELRENYDLLSEKEQALRESTEMFQAVVEQSNEDRHHRRYRKAPVCQSTGGRIVGSRRPGPGRRDQCA